MIVRKIKLIFALLGVLFSLALAPQHALAFEPDCEHQSATRFALTIGNSYEGGLEVNGKLNAKTVAAYLCDVGFSVMPPVLDADRDDLEAALGDFRRRIAEAEDIVVYFSGHGYQIAGVNYLLPAGSSFSTEKHFPVDRLLRAVAGAPGTASKIAILEACSNELPTASVDGERLEGLQLGLGNSFQCPRCTRPKRTLIAYSSSARALSGAPGELSPFTKELTDRIREPGLAAQDLFPAVRSAVSETTSGAQVAQFYGIDLIRNPYYFRSPVKLPVRVLHAADDVLAVLNEDLALAQKDKKEETLTLRAGENKLRVLVSNSRSYQSGQSWRIPAGWSYELQFDWPEDTEVVSVNGQPVDSSRLSRFLDREEIPFKDGPHHGGVFQVAEFDIWVHPETAKLRVEVEDDLWREQAELAARDQEILWESSIEDLPLAESEQISDYLGYLAAAKTLLEIFELDDEVHLPDPSTIWTVVVGNSAFRELARRCMEERWKDRLVDLELALADMLLVESVKPFERFDLALTHCAQELSDGSFPKDQIKLWTALDQRRGQSADQDDDAAPSLAAGGGR